LSNGLEFEIPSMPEEAESAEAYFHYYKPKSGDLVFDIGAYCGTFTRELSLAVGPTGRVIAFEPDSLNFELLQRNIARHGLANVVTVKAAVFDKNGTASFNSDGIIGSALTDALERPPSGETVQSETITLAESFNRYGTPSYIKIDAEGAEIEILSGAREMLRKHHIHFVLDTSHFRDGSTTTDRVEAIFRSCSYNAQSNSDFGGLSTTWATPSTIPAGTGR